MKRYTCDDCNTDFDTSEELGAHLTSTGHSNYGFNMMLTRPKDDHDPLFCNNDYCKNQECLILKHEAADRTLRRKYKEITGVSIE